MWYRISILFSELCFGKKPKTIEISAPPPPPIHVLIPGDPFKNIPTAKNLILSLYEPFGKNLITV